MTRHSNTVPSLLSCGCQPTYDPLPADNEPVICRKHGNQIVTVRMLDSWRMECSCGKSETFGMAKLSAERGAVKHRGRTRNNRSLHVVTVFNPSGETHHVFGDMLEPPIPNRD